MRTQAKSINRVGGALLVVVSAIGMFPGVARADVVERMLNWLGRHFKVKPSMTAGAFRGGSEAPGTLWLMPADGGVPRALTDRDHYMSAVFAGASLVAIRADGRVVRIDRERGGEEGTACAVGGTDAADVVFAGDDALNVGVVTRIGRVLELNPETCAARTVKKMPAATADANRVKLALASLGERCGGARVASVPQEDASGSGATREDIVQFGAAGASHVLTASSILRTHRAPAFSGDCRQIVYVAR